MTKQTDIAPSETLHVALLNTQFGDAFKHTDTVDRLLPKSGSEQRIVGFTEVTRRGARALAIAKIEEQGYRALVPAQGDIDTIWAASSGIQIDAETAHLLPGRFSSRPGKRQRRKTGTHEIDVTTTGGHKIRLGQVRLAPPMPPYFGRKSREKQLRAMAPILDARMAPNEGVTLDIHGGDQNHANGPKPVDRALWEPRGFSPGMEEGQRTYDLTKAGRLTRMAGKTAIALGLLKSQQYDAIYLRPGQFYKLTPENTDPGESQISFNTEAVPVNGTDHYAIETILRLPPKE